MSVAETRVDPITASVIGGALDSIAIEMGHKLARMSYSSIMAHAASLFRAVASKAQPALHFSSSVSTSANEKAKTGTLLSFMCNPLVIDNSPSK